MRLPIWDHGSGKLGFLFFFLWPRREEPLFPPPPFSIFHFSLLFTVSLGAARVDGRSLTWEGFDGSRVGTVDDSKHAASIMELHVVFALFFFFFQV